MSADNQNGDDVENGADVDPGTWTKVASGDIGVRQTSRPRRFYFGEYGTQAT